MRAVRSSGRATIRWPLALVAGNAHPDHDTIATFRRRFGEEAKAQIEAAAAQQANGFEPCYNAQLAGDRDRRLIVAPGLTQAANDQQ